MSLFSKMAPLFLREYGAVVTRFLKEAQVLAKEAVLNHNKLPYVKSLKAGDCCQTPRTKQLR